MKRYLCLPAILAFVSCTEITQDIITGQQQDDITGNIVTLSVEDFVFEDNDNDNTRTTITQTGTSSPQFAWKEGDVIGIVPMDGRTFQSNYKIEEIGADPKYASFDGGSWALKQGKEYAAYFPCQKEALASVDTVRLTIGDYAGYDPDRLPLPYKIPLQKANNSLEHLGDFDYMYAEAVPCNNGATNFRFKHLIALVRFQITCPEEETFTKIFLSGLKMPGFYRAMKMCLTDGTLTADESVEIQAPNYGYFMNLDNIHVNKGEILTVWIPCFPTNFAETSVLKVELDGKAEDWHSTVNITKDWKSGYAYSYSCSVTPNGFIDLGLPSGLKWATRNIGAKSPEEYGNYYQWGSLVDVTSTHIYVSSVIYPYYVGTTIDGGWTKYVPLDKPSYWYNVGNPDNKTVLDLEDDIAHVTLGRSWRMPTKAECEELTNCCVSEWTTLNGIAGKRLTSIKNGRSIFLPATGYRYGDELLDAGSNGDYWTSSLNTDNPAYAYHFVVNQGHTYVGSGVWRECGLTVRPVIDYGLYLNH